ncbi:hypothetical protein [Corynebacterium capitovis]|uniref:hypothetical protein n=1 Tax=Corynebacterium capitovis TaxID=131081 RepID=UPI0003605CA2|nr:hypothetical protein [Corynebacterium capitovis]
MAVAAVVRACAREESPSETALTREITPSELEVAPSQPVDMSIPAIGLTAPFDTVDCRVRDGALDPATLDKACAYTAPDRPYQLPGSDSSDIVVIAGHASTGRSAVFDLLYDGSTNHHTISTGDALYLRTQSSGKAWLLYRATDLHDPVKQALADDPSVWGSGPMPGRLLTVSCIQPATPLSESVRNVVIGWQFESVVAHPPASAPTRSP